MPRAVPLLVCLSLFVALLAPAAGARLAPRPSRPHQPPPLLKAQRLAPGSTVGFVSPASPPYYSYNQTTYQAHVISSLAALGLNVKFSPNSFVEWGYLAGTDEQRASDVMGFFTDPSIDAIIANRGGFGCGRMIDLLNYTLIAANPKPIMGYSDLTALLTAIHVMTGLVTFHGPMGIDDWDNANGAYFQQVVMQAAMPTFVIEDGVAFTTITSGKATGRLVGSNLSVFVSIMASPYFPASLQGCILFLEDVDEQPYALDRLVLQLKLAGNLNQIAGFVFGRCTNCTASDPFQSFTVDQVLQQYIAPLGVPAFSGAMFGHIEEQYTLPIGAMAAIDADAGTITLLEPGVL